MPKDTFIGPPLELIQAIDVVLKVAAEYEIRPDSLIFAVAQGAAIFTIEVDHADIKPTTQALLARAFNLADQMPAGISRATATRPRTEEEPN